MLCNGKILDIAEMEIEDKGAGRVAVSDVTAVSA
jgi:hypothetical protein